jgi:hypothetical protein
MAPFGRIVASVAVVTAAILARTAAAEPATVVIPPGPSISLVSH